jgi:hypothetical protein
VSVFSSVHAHFLLLSEHGLCHTSAMFDALSLADLDALDPAALKAMILDSTITPERNRRSTRRP